MSTSAEAGGVTLDSLFRANVGKRPEAIAVIDPRDRSSFTGSGSRRLSFAEMDARVHRLSLRLRSFGLPAASVIALQLPNIVESAISLLAILRAGHIAAPVPILWHRAELVAALATVEPKALITVTRFGDARPAETACEAAAELFHLSFPCAFGSSVPDGVIALDEPEEGSAAQDDSAGRPASPSIVTFDTSADGFFAVARNDAQWLAAGMATLLEADIRSGDGIISALPLNSLAGIGSVLVPWLLSGGTLQLLQGPSTPSVETEQDDQGIHLVAPAIALSRLAQEQVVPFASCIAVHRNASMGAMDFSKLPAEKVVDLYVFGESGLVPIGREHGSAPSPIPLGPIFAPSSSESGTIVLETRADKGEVLLRGPMVPRAAFPAAARPSGLPFDQDGFLRSGFRCRSDGNGSVIIDGGPDRVATVGALRFGLDDLERRLATAFSDIKVRTESDPLLGDRLRIETDSPFAAAAAIQAAGHSPLVVGAVTRGAQVVRAAG